MPDDCQLLDNDCQPDGVPDDCEGSVLLGDLNCDQTVDVFDVDPFVMAITAPSQYQNCVEFCACNYLLADCNQDGFVDVFDIDAFVAIVVGE